MDNQPYIPKSAPNGPRPGEASSVQPNIVMPSPSPETAPVPAPVEAAPAAPPAAAPAMPAPAPMPMPAAVPASAPVPAAPLMPVPGAPAAAGDVDVIEPEWVEKAEEVIAAHQNDPYGEEQAVERLQEEYLQKRYGVTVTDPNSGNGKVNGS